MNITTTHKTKEVKLGSLQSGDVMHFAYTSFDAALEDKAVYMVSGSVKDSKVTLVNIVGGEQIVRDECHHVIKLDAELVVKQ